ncbi:transcriptional regulator, TraR/DksA family [Shewanella halifaxensis HAW-EB4]|uniref:Transcriptional regulator, TraR/DksA family n=1 Tax=Shewanella halifaxensis (strain HAW-EB4) TaxID=458817 RepID=B0TKU6_SHEHH|nr:TraR/DksA C4-type zinc finger protein [Shewanella halifaxensis]ABZ75898.1 transcriptional regulator, TraR/DksA family [Shewanella halifaxensis HAW-EB4]
MDEGDESVRVQARALNQYLAGRATKLLVAKASASYCARCGEDIPEPRRQAVKGVQLCIDCQTLSERKQ